MSAPLVTPVDDIENGEGWIEWAGGECPVAHHTMVQVKFRDGIYSSQHPGATAGYWHGNGSPETSCWLHDDENPNSDIIAYRLVSK